MKKKKPSNQTLPKLLVGITGGIGAGKSAVATVYRELGYPVFSADEIAREIVEPGTPALREIRELFGSEAMKADGTLDRAFVRKCIAEEPPLRFKLETITHPRIQARTLQLAKQAFSEGAKIVFYEAPLLFEAKSEKKMDKVICVHADDKIRIKRVVKRDGGTRELAEKLLASQMPQAEKMRLSDYAIENNGSEKELKKAALSVLERLNSTVPNSP